MASQAMSSPTSVPRKRYVKMPETANVKRYRDLWLAESADIDPLSMCSSLILAAHRLTIGRFKGHHWYACIVSDVERPAGWPNALSGWGDTPDQALRELSFRWHIGMNGSWDPQRWNIQVVPVLLREEGETGA